MSRTTQNDSCQQLGDWKIHTLGGQKVYNETEVPKIILHFLKWIVFGQTLINEFA